MQNFDGKKPAPATIKPFLVADAWVPECRAWSQEDYDTYREITINRLVAEHYPHAESWLRTPVARPWVERNMIAVANGVDLPAKKYCDEFRPPIRPDQFAGFYEKETGRKPYSQEMADRESKNQPGK